MKTMDYLTQASEFLRKTKTEFECELLKHGKHFEDDKEERDIYKITLKRGNRSFTFNFGQSITSSGQYKVVKHLQNKVWCEQTTGGKISLSKEEFQKLRYVNNIHKDILLNPNFKQPSEYDVLACLTKYDPETFEDFCSNFGYEEDSLKAEKVYKAVVNEWHNVAMLWNDKEIEQLQEIN